MNVPPVRPQQPSRKEWSLEKIAKISSYTPISLSLQTEKAGSWGNARLGGDMAGCPGGVFYGQDHFHESVRDPGGEGLFQGAQQ